MHPPAVADGVAPSTAWLRVPDPRGRAVALCIAGAWLLTAATHYYVIVPAGVLDRVTADLGVGSSAAIWLVSAIPGTWALTNVALGGWIDRLGTVRMIELGTGLFVAMALSSWVAAGAGSFWWLLSTRLVAGVGVGVIWTASTDLVGGLVGTRARATAIGVFLTSAPGGFALGQLLAPRVASAGAWPANFLVVAAGAVVAVGTLEVAVRRLDVAPVATPASVLSNLASVRSSPAVRYGSVLAFAAYSVYLFLNSWLPTYLVEEFAATAALAGLLSAVFPAMGILSRAGGGLLSDRLLGGRRVPVLLGAFLVSVPLVAAVAVLRSIFAIVLALVVAGFVIQLTFGVVYSYVRESVATARTGTALSVVTSAGIAGAFSAPIVTGALIDYTGGFGAAFGYAVVLALLGVALAWVAPEAASGE